jgi:ankyrin repeat protein
MKRSIRILTAGGGTARSVSLGTIFLAALIGLTARPAATHASELHDAVRSGDVVAVEARLAAGAEVDETDFILGTPLHLAVAQGNTSIAQVLIEHGADVNVPSEQKGSRPLHLAARFGDAAMLVLLLENGAEIDSLDDYQRTPLHRAAEKGHGDVVRVLIERGADVTAREGKRQATPLHWAAGRGHLESVELLLEAGADIHATDHSGWTPFAWAAFPQSYAVVGGSDLLEYLIAKGADPNTRDLTGLSPLEYAHDQVRNGDVKFAQIVEVLRRLGATE